MAATTQTVIQLLQLHYLPGIVRQFNAAFPLLRFIRQRSDTVDGQGEKAVIAIELGLNEGGGFHGESADVAESGHPRIRRVEVTLKQLTFRARLTYKLMRKARTNAHAFARAAQLQMTGTREAFVLTANTYLWGDGSGVICRVKDASDLASDRILTLDRAYGLSDGGAPAAIIRPGQTLHILDTKGYEPGVTTDRGTAIVEAVDDDTGTEGEIAVRVEAGHTLSGVTADDYVYLQNTIEGWFDPGEAEDNRPAMGMLGFYDDSLRDTLQGLSPTQSVGGQPPEPQWKPRKVPVNQATLIPDMRRAKNRLAKKAERGRIGFVISSYETHERYAAQLDEKVEFRNVRSLDALWDVGEFDGRPWFMDHTAPDGRMFFVPVGTGGGFISRFAVDDFINFVDEGGGAMQRVPNKTVFDTLITAVYDYGIRRRNVLVSATGMTWAPGSTPGG